MDVPNIFPRVQRGELSISFRKISGFILFYSLLLSFAGAFEDDGRSAIALRNALSLGAKLKEAGNFKEAIEQYRSARRISRELNNYPEEARALMHLGLLNWNVGRVKDSFDNFKEAQALASKSNLKKEEQSCLAAMEIQSLYSKAMDSRSSGKYKESIDYFKKAGDLARQIGSPEHESKCLRQQSLNYWELNDIEEYLKLNIRALRLANATKNRREEGICNNNIGLYYWKRCDYSKALKNFQLALEFAEKEHEIEIESLGASNISLIYKDIGEYDKALQYISRVIKIDRELKNEFYISIDLNNLGVIYKIKGIISNQRIDFQKAIEFYRESLILARKISNKKIECSALINIADAWVSMNEINPAIDYLNLALQKSLESQGY